MPVIHFYSSKFDTVPTDSQTCQSHTTLHQWLTDNVPSYRPDGSHPISAMLNGTHFPVNRWCEAKLNELDVVTLTLEPKAFAPAWLPYVLAAVAAAGAVYYARQALPDNYNKSTPEGSPIYDVNVQGNRPRLMGIIPEIFGTHKVYFDLLNAQQWYFSGDDEYLLMFCAVGVGWYDMPLDVITIGNTPVANYAGDIDISKFNPGENVTSHPAYRNVYTSPEVGATAGTGGIELEGAVNSLVPSKLILNQTVITIYQNIDGFLVPYWPPEWEVGQRIDISGTPGAKSVSEENAYGGWRMEATTDLLNFWSKDPALHDCRKGDYVQYPISYSEQNNQTTIEYATGMIDGKFNGFENNENFYAVRVVDANGNVLPVSTVPAEARHDPIQFWGKDDGTYRVVDRTSTNATLLKLYPNKSTGMSSWSGFASNGEYSSIRLTATETFPGKIAGPFRATPVGQKTDEVIVDLRWPRGIGYIEDKGNVSSREIRVMLEWREVGATTWQQIEFKRSGATRDQLGSTIPIKLSQKAEIEMRFYRITGKNDDTRVLDTVELVRVKSVLDSNTSFSDITTIALRIRGTNALSRSAENKFSGIPTRKLQVPDGQGGWTTDLHPTNDIAPVCRYIAKECGFTDYMIAQQNLLALHEVWSARGDEFNAVFDTDSTHFEAQRRVLACGYAMPTLDYGQLIPVRDERRTGEPYMYQPDNMTTPLKVNVTNFDPDEHDSVEVEYMDSASWKSATILCKLPDSQGIRPKKVKAFGITDRKLAWRFGMREIRDMRFRRKNYTFSTELDGLNSTYMSRADLGWNVPGYGQNGRVIRVESRQGYTSIYTNVELTWQKDKSHVIALRRPDGTQFGPVTASRGLVTGEVRISDPLDFFVSTDGTMEPPYFMFGTQEQWRLPALVVDVTPEGTDKVTIKGVNYDERVYQDDDNEPPAELMVGY